MRLQINYVDEVGFSQPIKTSHDGFAGGSQVKSIGVKSISHEHYYQNIELEISKLANVLVDENTLLSDSGWSIKMKVSEVEPSEEEWAYVIPNTSILLEDIGTELNADTDFLQRVWIRLFCPGNSNPDILESELKLKYNTLLVHNESL